MEKNNEDLGVNETKPIPDYTPPKLIVKTVKKGKKNPILRRKLNE